MPKFEMAAGLGEWRRVTIQPPMREPATIADLISIPRTPNRPLDEASSGLDSPLPGPSDVLTFPRPDWARPH